MNFNKIIETPFCEGKILGIPEYLNSISSLYMCYLGYKGLTNKKEIYLDIYKIYSFLVICGISSFFFHYTMFIGWKMFDEFTMVLTLWHGIYILKKMIYNRTKIKFIKYTNYLHIFNSGFLVLNFFKGWAEYFPILFGIEMTTLLYDYYLISSRYKDKSLYGFYGLLLMALSAGTWMITENFCNKYLIFGHAVWHIGIATGLNNFIYYVINIINEEDDFNNWCFV